MFIRGLPASAGGEVTPGDGSSGFTSGAVIVADASGFLNEDPTVLFWDTTNNFLGVGTNAPASVLHVTGSVSPAAGASAAGVTFASTLVEAGSGAHARLAGVQITAPTVTAGLATVTVASTLYITAPPTGTFGTTYLVEAAPDTDANCVFGRVLIGSSAADNAVFAHFDRFGTTGQALTQAAGGQVTLAAPSVNISFMEDTATIFQIQGSTNNIIFNNDNTRDLGAIGATRPANIFLGTAAYAPAYYLTTSTDSTTRAKLNVTKVTKAHDSDLFNAAGLTDSVAVFTQPANSILVAAYIMLDTQFAAVGMTDLDVTIGDAGNNAGILNATGNMTSDAANTKYTTKGAYFDATAGTLLKESATAWTAYATAVGANLDTTSAGQISIYFVTIEW